MIKNIYDNLKTGGLFCSLNDNVCSPIEAYNNPNLKKHAVYREYFGETLSDGQTIQYTFHFDINTSSNCVFSIYHFSPSTYEELFKKCGFSSFEWVPMQCNPTADNICFFDDFIRLPSCIGIIAKK